MRETPSITDSGHSHTAYAMTGGGISPLYTGGTSATTTTSTPMGWDFINRRLQQHEYLHQPVPVQAPKQQKAKDNDTMSRRIVQVFIADTDENVPLNKSVIYTGEQKLTDLTDQELFFEIEIKKLLDAHNAYRTTLINKKVKERSENLEPIKIRDLKMVVTTIAEFK